MSEIAIEYLGKELFDLYKEKHSEVTEETKVEPIMEHQVRYGFQVVKPYQYLSVYDMSPIGSKPELITILPEQFETWVQDKHSTRYKLAYNDETNTIYAYSYRPQY